MPDIARLVDRDQAERMADRVVEIRVPGLGSPAFPAS
jgi:hypothetical protein